MDNHTPDVAATLTAALIHAAGRPHSVAEAVRLYRDFSFALRPRPGLGSYDAWLKDNTTETPHA